MDKIRNEEIRRRVNMQPAEQTRIRSGGGHMSRGWHQQLPRVEHSDPPSRKTTKGKATKSMRRRRSEMVRGDGDPDDRCQQLGEGETSECIPTRRRWQKSSSKVSKVK